MSHIYYSVKYSKAFWAIIKGVDPGRDGGGGAQKQFLYLGGRLSHYKLPSDYCMIRLPTEHYLRNKKNSRNYFTTF